MSEQIVNGSNIKYSLVYINNEDIQLIKNLEKKRHEIVGYSLIEDYPHSYDYSFYSVEDNYSQPILNHWTKDIIKKYDSHTCWILIKKHPYDIYSIMIDILKPGNFICDVGNFDIWKTDAKDCLVAVILDMTID